MAYRITLAGNTHRFDDLRTLLAKATPLRSGDELAGLAARIALGRTGGSLPTDALLDFRLAHARARDAVESPFHATGFAGELRDPGVEVLCVETAAKTRPEFLRRPELGRRLGNASRVLLEAHGSGAADASMGAIWC